MTFQVSEPSVLAVLWLRRPRRFEAFAGIACFAGFATSYATYRF